MPEKCWMSSFLKIYPGIFLSLSQPTTLNTVLEFDKFEIISWQAIIFQPIESLTLMKRASAMFRNLAKKYVQTAESKTERLLSAES